MMGKTINSTLLGLIACVSISGSASFAQPESAPPTPASAPATGIPVENPAIPKIDLQNPALIEGLKKIQGFWPEDFAKTVQGKEQDQFLVTANSDFFAPLDETALTARKANNAKYTPFKGDMLPSQEADVMLGAMEYRTVITLENGKKITTDQIVGAVLPDTGFLHVTYAASPDHGENWHVPKTVLVSSAIYAVPVIRAEKPNGRYIVIMPMRDATFADTVSAGTAHGDYVMHQITALMSEKIPPVPKADHRTTITGGIESYDGGDIIYIDPDQLDARLRKSPGPTKITRPLAVTDVHTVDINGTTVVVALGTEITDAKNAFVLPLRMAVTAKEVVFGMHANKVPNTATSVSIGITTDGDATKLQGYVMMRSTKKQKVSTR
ncbi:MAG: hypothetical protein EYC62_03945 [Alphaproteobacteria bacterium]|nr:MAG: hypothetical protein EYC62_03945 [Alphaproteobacteria bacterium]